MPRSYKTGRARSSRSGFSFKRAQFGRRKFVRRARAYGGRSKFQGGFKRRKAFFSTGFGRKISGGLRSRMRGSKMGFVSKGRYAGGSRVWAGANSARYFKTRRLGRPSTAPYFDHPPRAYGGPKVPTRSVFPFDTYYVTTTTGPQYVPPATSNTNFMEGVMGGLDLGTIKNNTQTEQVFTQQLALEPTLYIDWECVIELCNMGTSDLYFEVIPYNRKQGAVSSLATQATAWAGTWPISYDNRPTGFENFPETSLLANSNWWKLIATPLRPRYIRVPVGKVVKVPFKSRKTKTVRRDDLPNNTTFYSTGGFLPFKTIQFIIKVTAQMGQACGVVSAVNTPTATTVGGDYIINNRAIYRYRYRYENQMQSIYGNHLPTNYTVSTAAQTFVGVPATRSIRAVNDAVLHNTGTFFGGLDGAAKTDININPVGDCASGLFTPTVHTA